MSNKIIDFGKDVLNSALYTTSNLKLLKERELYEINISILKMMKDEEKRELCNKVIKTIRSIAIRNKDTIRLEGEICIDYNGSICTLLLLDLVRIATEHDRIIKRDYIDMLLNDIEESNKFETDREYLIESYIRTYNSVNNACR
ncbi:MAG: hypothetical protein ARM1_0605 [Candidatus Micrarchaeota archaeon]|nr:MAG: hypothetical protein ARM1_0605 [Candidatus Micrarchaeota archaeon]